MSDSFNFDYTEIDRLAADIEQAPEDAGPKIYKAVEVGARHVKDDWRQELPKSGHAKALPYAVSYDVTTLQMFGVSIVQAEIGPDKEKAQGALGNLLEFGSINNAPQGVGHAALEREQADFERGLAIAIGDPL